MSPCSFKGTKFIKKVPFEIKIKKNIKNIYKNLPGLNSFFGIDFIISNKKIFVLGAGGVAPSIIYSLKKMKVSKITLSNRTKEKAQNLKNLFKDIEIIDWGETIDFDMIINATSVGLKNEDGLNFDYSVNGPNKFFYDVIYNPKQTIFLKRAKMFGNQTENGKMMFIYQAHQAFTIWHKVMPEIDDETIKLLD